MNTRVARDETATAPQEKRGDPRESWQLKMFSVAIKKKQKLRCLRAHIRPPIRGRSLLITGGDNNGALNYHIRESGGDWEFCELEPQNVEEMSAFLGTPVRFSAPDALPYEDGIFDLVVTIDCHEHLDDPAVLNREILRVLRPGGRAIVTVPNGNERKLAVRIKHLIGMDKQRYGHKVVGYDVPDLERMLADTGFEVGSNSSYSRFFTEILELAINFAYMKVLARKDVEDGQIAPTSADQLRKVQKTYRIYRFVYPFFWLWSKLDVLVPFGRGYAVAVESTKPAA